MSEQRPSKRSVAPTPLFPQPNAKKHPRLFLGKYLAEEAHHFLPPPGELERATAALKQWADAALAGDFEKKNETTLDGEFLEIVFGNALGYKSLADSPADYHRVKNPPVPGIGIADGALGLFASGKDVAPTVILELKGAQADLDRDKTDGRTAVQQCWDYLNQLPDTPWGIVSNYVTIRLYHKSSPARAYEEFTVADFLDPDRLKQFYYIFEKNGLVGNKLTDKKNLSRAARLLKKTESQKREVGDELYVYYADQRENLIDELMTAKGMPQDTAIHYAQKLLDRIIFMAFCESRGLLPERLIDSTWRNVAPLARATNPRWRNFLDAFHAIDKGHSSLDLPTGYNGGLFRHDPVIDDLDLGDRWADVFHEIGGFDFREEGEISVDVLGHIFERSITELERMRVVGLFGKQKGDDPHAAMPKSAERKRSGTYYTPPQFTQLIVEQTLGTLITERVESLPDLRARIPALRKLKIVDPACGSGAFLIAAYERLEEAYEDIARELRKAGHIQEALNITNAYPDYILADQLFGVDLSAESVEISQLALWIRSARRGRTLMDLSNNIKRGNSLVRDKSVHPEALDWHFTFPTIFANGGFDVVIGNPPWERMKVQEREFFSLAAPEIASAVNAADRRKLIAAVESARPDLWARYVAAQQAAETSLAYVRTEGADFPLTGRGDVNTYMLFAELARRLVAPTGRAGLLVPSGIATDHTTKEFFADLMESKTLTGLFDFENKHGWFEDVHRAFKFTVLLMNGSAVSHEKARFVFFAHEMKDLSDPSRQISLSQKDLKLLNPNTRTCPIFRTKQDAELTKKVYRAIPILVDNNRKSGGNPWGVKFCTMFHQTNDAEHFVTEEKLISEGFSVEGNRWVKDDLRYLPLYEAKMFQMYDHRASSVVVNTDNWFRQGQKETASLVDHQNPEFVVLPRWWASEKIIANRMPGSETACILGFKNVTSPTNRRTMIAAFLPVCGVINSAPLIGFENPIPYRRRCCLAANLNTLPYDYCIRNKVGNVNLNFFILEQIPTLPPDIYDEKCPWNKKQTLEDWIADRVLKLTCTADDMRPLAAAAGFAAGVHKWKEDERARLRAELDAAYFHLYRLSREDVSYILGTFQGIVDEDEKAKGIGPTRGLILDAFDKMQ